MSQKKKKVIYLTVHSSKKLNNRFKKIFGRWKEAMLTTDENAKPTQKQFLNTALDLMAEELGVEL